MTSSIDALQQYPWPAPSTIPKGKLHWDGEGFEIDPTEPKRSVLVYDQNDSHWSEELTDLHETEAGNGDHPIDRASRALALRTVESHLGPRSGPILDVGCSSGFFLRDFKQRHPAAPVIGADFIAGPLRKLATALPGVPLLQFDLRQCPLPSDRLAAVVCLNVLEHIDRDEQALQHIHRILQPGGVAHVEVPAAPSCYDIYDEHLMHHRRYTLRELAGKARAAGFRVVSTTHLGALVFPAFYAVKRRNRRHLALPAEAKAELIRKMMRTTRHSLAMKVAMQFELILGRLVSYPFGIRCVAVLQKQ